MKRRVFWVVVMLALIAAACGGKDGSEKKTSVEREGQEVEQPVGQNEAATSETVLDEESDGIVMQSTQAAVAPPMEAQAAAAPGQAPVQVTQDSTIPQEPDDMFFEEYGVNPMLDTEDDHLSTFAMGGRSHDVDLPAVLR